MFPLPITFYVKAGLFVLVFLSGLYLGYSREHSKFIAYQERVEALGKAQEAKVESIKKQQELVTKGIQNEYDAKLAAIRNYYKSTSVWNNPSSSKVSGLSAAPSATDVITAYNQLAAACAETTQQLISLQDWIREQVGIK